MALRRSSRLTTTALAPASQTTTTKVAAAARATKTTTTTTTTTTATTRKKKATVCEETTTTEKKQRPAAAKRGKKAASRVRGETVADEDAPSGARDIEFVFGVDEAGRGPWAGPVTVAACYLPPGVVVDGVTDSKAIATEAEREAVYAVLTTTPGVEWAVAQRSAAEIDASNILRETLGAMREASHALARKLGGGGAATGGGCDDDEEDGDCDGGEEVEVVRFLALVDGNQDPWKLRRVGAARRGLASKTIVKGDASEKCISAASVIAKVTRDRIMHELHDRHPMYNFKKHKGYGVPEHRAALAIHGPCEAHRASYKPIRDLLEARAAADATHAAPPDAADAAAPKRRRRK